MMREREREGSLRDLRPICEFVHEKKITYQQRFLKRRSRNGKGFNKITADDRRRDHRNNDGIHPVFDELAGLYFEFAQTYKPGSRIHAQFYKINIRQYRGE